VEEAVDAFERGALSAAPLMRSGGAGTGGLRCANVPCAVICSHSLSAALKVLAASVSSAMNSTVAPMEGGQM
jgi:hypothetical protein